MRPVPDEDLLDIMGCEIDQRPAAAPGIDDLAPFVRSAVRTADALTVRFTAAARDSLLAFVEAERHCCAGIGWTVTETPELALRVEAAAPALAVISDLFGKANIDSNR